MKIYKNILTYSWFLQISVRSHPTDSWCLEDSHCGDKIASTEGDRKFWTAQSLPISTLSPSSTFSEGWLPWQALSSNSQSSNNQNNLKLIGKEKKNINTKKLEVLVPGRQQLLVSEKWSLALQICMGDSRAPVEEKVMY